MFYIDLPRFSVSAKSIGQKLFVELNNNFKSLTEKASSKDNYNATFKELNP